MNDVMQREGVMILHTSSFLAPFACFDVLAKFPSNSVALSPAVFSLF